MPSVTRREWLFVGFVAVISPSATGCGTILYPERRGQRSGRFDWGVVALNAVGLLFFFIPGVIAFAVDFSTGAIYLPETASVPAQSSRKPQSPGRRLLSKLFPAKEISRADIEEFLAEQTGREISLIPGQYETEPLESIDDFWTLHDLKQPAGMSIERG